MNKQMLKVLGIIFLVLGLLLALGGIFAFIFSASKMVSSTGSFEQANSSIGKVFFGAGFGMGLLLFGAITLALGGILIYLASLKKITSFVAKETASATKTTFTAVGKGLKRGRS